MSTQMMAMRMLTFKSAMEKSVAALKRAIRIEQATMEELLQTYAPASANVCACQDNIQTYQESLDELKKALVM